MERRMEYVIGEVVIKYGEENMGTLALNIHLDLEISNEEMEELQKAKAIEEMARIIAFDLCPFGKLDAKLYDNKANCASNDNFAECTKINKVVFFIIVSYKM